MVSDCSGFQVLSNDNLEIVLKETNPSCGYPSSPHLPCDLLFVERLESNVSFLRHIMQALLIGRTFNLIMF